MAREKDFIVHGTHEEQEKEGDDPHVQGKLERAK